MQQKHTKTAANNITKKQFVLQEPTRRSGTIKEEIKYKHLFYSEDLSWANAEVIAQSNEIVFHTSGILSIHKMNPSKTDREMSKIMLKF